MGVEEVTEKDSSFSTLKLPFLPLEAAAIIQYSPDHPLQTLASVPFKWEEQPGKPRPCTDIIALPAPFKCLDLPPCRNITKMPSPTAVLDGPYTIARPKFSSFRLFREGQGSFDSSSSDSPRSSVDILLGNKLKLHKRRGLFFGRSLRFKSGKKGVDEEGISFGISSPSSAIGCEISSGEIRVKMQGNKLRRNGSLSSLSTQPTSSSTPRLCATLYKKLKQAIPWKSKRSSKKEGVPLKECDHV